MGLIDIVKVAALIEKRGISFTHIARELGVKGSSSNLYIVGKRMAKNPKMDEVPKIAELLGVPVQELILKDSAPQAIQSGLHNQMSTGTGKIVSHTFNSAGTDPNMQAIHSMDLPDSEKARLLEKYLEKLK